MNQPFCSHEKTLDMDVLKNKGFRKGNRVPPTKKADELWQKEVVSEGLNIDFYLTAWVYHPTDYNPKTTVEFDFQVDHDDSNSGHSTKVKMFSFDASNLSGRTVDKVIEKSRNLYKYIQHQ